MLIRAGKRRWAKQVTSKLGQRRGRLSPLTVRSYGTCSPSQRTDRKVQQRIGHNQTRGKRQQQKEQCRMRILKEYWSITTTHCGSRFIKSDRENDKKSWLVVMVDSSQQWCLQIVVGVVNSTTSSFCVLSFAHLYSYRTCAGFFSLNDVSVIYRSSGDTCHVNTTFWLNADWRHSLSPMSGTPAWGDASHFYDTV